MLLISTSGGFRLKALLIENLPEISSGSCPDPPRPQTVVPCLQHTARLRGEHFDAKELRALVDRQSVAGLRNTADVISRLPYHRKLGNILAQLFGKILRESPVVREMLLRLAGGEHSLESAEALSAELDTPRCAACSVSQSPVLCEFGAGGQCGFRAHLLHSWAKSARDPRVEVCSWRLLLVSVLCHMVLRQFSRAPKKTT